MTTTDARKIRQAAELLQKANFVCALTGAGVSTESGVPTFRGSDGLWQGYSVTELASPEGFRANPKKVWEFYNHRRQVLASVKPNAGHYALAQFESHFQDFGLATQNVDRLHQLAGSKKVVELHGNIWEVRCSGCEKTYDKTGVELEAEPVCSTCNHLLRPAVVWFGESLSSAALAKIEEWSSQCDVFLIAGTSAVVFPAASFAYLAKERGAKVIEINLEETPASEIADLSLFGKAGEILPKLVH